jgi:hypothetical protein
MGADRVPDEHVAQLWPIAQPCLGVPYQRLGCRPDEFVKTAPARALPECEHAQVTMESTEQGPAAAGARRQFLGARPTAAQPREQGEGLALPHRNRADGLGHRPPFACQIGDDRELVRDRRWSAVMPVAAQDELALGAVHDPVDVAVAAQAHYPRRGDAPVADDRPNRNVNRWRDTGRDRVQRAARVTFGRGGRRHARRVGSHQRALRQ